MRFTLKGWLLAAVVGAALLAAATPASAQFINPYARGYRPYYGPGYGGFGLGVNPGFYGPGTNGYGLNPYNYPAASMYSTPAYSPAFVPPPASNPYYGGGSQATLVTTPGGSTGVVQTGDPYLSPYTSNPYASFYNPAGGYLSGLADVTTATANATVTVQRARLVQQEAFRSQVDTRRKIWEEARYERASLMNSEQMRLANIQSALDRARHDPPLTEIWSGQSLNDLFNYLTAQQGKVGKGPNVPLSEEMLKHINLTPGTGGNVGLLKSDLKWPAPLQRTDFDETRKKLEEQVTEAVRQAKFQPVDVNKVADIKSNIQKMQDMLLAHVNDMQPAEYMTAKKYLNMLDESARALGDPKVNDYFNGKWTAKGKTVADLIENMKSGEAAGTKFAPAAPGDEWAYRALYYALRDYDAGMTQLTSAPKP